MLNYALRVNLTIAIVEMIYDDNDNLTAAMNITHGPHNVTEVRFTTPFNVYCLEIIETDMACEPVTWENKETWHSNFLELLN